QTTDQGPPLSASNTIVFLARSRERTLPATFTDFCAYFWLASAMFWANSEHRAEASIGGAIGVGGGGELKSIRSQPKYSRAHTTAIGTPQRSSRLTSRGSFSPASTCGLALAALAPAVDPPWPFVRSSCVRASARCCSALWRRTSCSFSYSLSPVGV